MFLSRLQPERTSTFSWNEGDQLGKLTATTKLAFPETSIFWSLVRFLSQKKENSPLKLFIEKLNVFNADVIFEDGVTGILPSKRFCERLKCSRRGSENNDGMLPFSRLELKSNSRRFRRLSKTEDGSTPPTPVNWRCKTSRETNFPIDAGIVPFKQLLLSLRYRSLVNPSKPSQLWKVALFMDKSRNWSSGNEEKTVVSKRQNEWPCASSTSLESYRFEK